MFSDSKVVLISNTPNPEKICDSAARLSQVDKLGTEVYNTDYEKKVLGHVIKLGHRSVLEHSYFNFVFENVSVFIEHFMIEFRLGSYTVKSRRYVDFRKAGYVIPEYLYQDKFSNLKQEFDQNIKYFFDSYSKLVDHKIPVEDARFILPYCFKSNFFLSMNGRELIHAIYSMIYGKGKNYPEVVHLGKEMLSQLKEKAPLMFANITYFINENENKYEKILNILEDTTDQKADKNVEVLYATKNAEELICKSIATVLRKNSNELNNEQKEKIIEILVSDRRNRELELANYTFTFRDITYPFLTHFIRHRIHSPLIPPFDYTDYKHVIIPPSVKANKEALEIYNECINKYLAFNELLIKAGVPQEQMIYSRLAGCTLDVVTSMNARELLHFLALRTCERAQWEIREYSDKLLKELKKHSPIIFKHAGPSCVLYGKCPEGKMTCGKAKEKKEYYSKL